MYSYHMGSVWRDSHSPLKNVVFNDSSDTLFRYNYETAEILYAPRKGAYAAFIIDMIKMLQPLNYLIIDGDNDNNRALLIVKDAIINNQVKTARAWVDSVFWSKSHNIWINNIDFSSKHSKLYAYYGAHFRGVDCLCGRGAYLPSFIEYMTRLVSIPDEEIWIKLEEYIGKYLEGWRNENQ